MTARSLRQDQPTCQLNERWRQRPKAPWLKTLNGKEDSSGCPLAAGARWWVLTRGEPCVMGCEDDLSRIPKELTS